MLSTFRPTRAKVFKGLTSLLLWVIGSVSFYLPHPVLPESRGFLLAHHGTSKEPHMSNEFLKKLKKEGI